MYAPPKSSIFGRFADVEDKKGVFPALNVPEVLQKRSNDPSTLASPLSTLSLSTLDLLAAAVSSSSTSDSSSPSMSNPLTSVTDNPTSTQTKKPLNFTDLPLELQLKIWNEAARFPRTIHLIPATHHYSETDSHLDYAISPSSLKVPVVLHVCQTSRNEALTIYERRTFQHSRTYRKYPELSTGVEALESRFMDVAIPSKVKEFPYVYFNPVSDVLLFGKGLCVGVMHSVFRLGQEIQRVGCFVGKVEACCGGEMFRGMTSKSLAVTNFLKALHGDIPEMRVVEGYMHNAGCKGLKEVLFVVKSKLWHPSTLDINTNVGFRSVRCTGTTEDEMKDYEILDSQLALCKQGVGLWSKFPYYNPEWNKWTGPNLPQFSYVNFAPTDLEDISVPKHLDGMKISKYSMTRLRPFFTPTALKELEARTACQLFMMEQDENAEQAYEVGLWGTNAANERAKAWVHGMVKELMQKDSKELVDGGTRKVAPYLADFTSFLDKRR